MAEEFLEKYPPVKPPARDAPLWKRKPVVDDKPPRQILFLGDEKVGKTTFITNYCEHMRDYYRCDLYEFTYHVFTQFLQYSERGEKLVPTRFLDLPAGLTEGSRRGQYPTRADLVVICFSISDQASFNHAWEVWLPEFQHRLPTCMHYRLLGLKNDMREEMEDAGKIPVSAERAQDICALHEFSDRYLECSVERNPQYARNCMDELIASVIRRESQRFRNV